MNFIRIQSANLALVVSGILTTTTAHSYIDSASNAFNRDGMLTLLAAHPNATKLDEVPALLPEPFLLNFILKHGVKRIGERGHLVESKVSQSSDPMAPRAIIWDERSGFSVSFNGGLANQTANQRLDMLSFDAKASTFLLEQIDFPLAVGGARPQTTDCASCHGPQHRPIFSMYPDWPSFYGSDNDELTGNSEVQKKEFADYTQFRATIAAHHPRYKPLFSSNRVKQRLGTDIYPSFPYRPNTAGDIQNVSRSFAFRPELRMGIMYNRLTSRSLISRIQAHKNYHDHAAFFLFNLLECSPALAQQSRVTRAQSDAASVIGKAPRLYLDLMDYRQMWALFDMQVNDVDIRYTYGNADYANEDASDNVMRIGYIGRYFNSYFDGSATIDELVAAAIYEDLAASRPELKGLATPRGLVDKYQHLTARFKIDGPFFKQMDRFAKWIPIPYPSQLTATHHREGFSAAAADQHKRLCAALPNLM